MSLRVLLLWGVVALVAVTLFVALLPSAPKAPELAYSDLLHRLEAGEVESVTMRGDVVAVHLSNQRDYRSVVPQGETSSLVRQLYAANVRISAVEERRDPTLIDILLGLLPMLLLIGAWYFFMRQMRAKQGAPPGNG